MDDSLLAVRAYIPLIRRLRGDAQPNRELGERRFPPSVPNPAITLVFSLSNAPGMSRAQEKRTGKIRRVRIHFLQQPMQLTRAADYGIRAMVYLAGLPAGSRASITDLAKAAEVSEGFLTKVLQRLIPAGLIASRRGPGGGFELNAPASEISLLQIVEAIEGPIQLNLCTGKPNGSVACGRQNWCAVHLVWQHAQAKLREILGSASIDALARDSGRGMAAIHDISMNDF